MNTRLSAFTFLSLAMVATALGHDLSSGDDHPHYDWTVTPPGVVLAQAGAGVGDEPLQKSRPAQAAAFALFAPRVSVRWDDRFLFVESNGLPAHNMMVGITAWQQQVPLPQDYTGANAWQIPLAPVPASSPVSIKGRFLRGAIALAANGIPIFNPQNNRGEISAEIGELDEWGGHCGRADDYHYHAAPLHLQSVLGPKLPIAYALDGYPIYGLAEPDGSRPADLDVCNGHATAALGYHYHASETYPYVNGGFHGEVVEREGQVDPQPRAQPLREALPGLRGAKITGFETTGDDSYKLTYDLNGEKRAILYAIKADGTYPFEFQNGSEGTKKEVYTKRQRGGGDGRSDSGPRPDASPVIGGSAAMDAVKKPNATFVLTSPDVADGGNLPVDYTGDGIGATPPLAWKGAPAETQSYALVMDHLAPGNEIKSYWTMWDIPATTTSLAKNVKGVGKLGTSFKGAVGYEPPHSQGPGLKTYVITVYALSASPQINQPPREVTREVLLNAIKDKVLASASLSVVSSRDGEMNQAPERPAPDRPAGEGRARPGGKGGADNKGLIKPTIADTMKLNVYADNWFVLYVNDRLVAVDPIQFTPHNVVSVDFLPEYPMTIAVMAKDNADPKTGLEYGTNIGDGGFILKFGDGTVTNATWKAKNFFKGPLNRDTANPKVEHTPIPDLWWAADFDDSKWPKATEYSEERINPKQPYFDADFKGAKFIWTEDLDLDNTVIFRTKIEKPGWTPRWNTRPDLDVTGAPFN